jgi:hypothetical protein
MNESIMMMVIIGDGCIRRSPVAHVRIGVEDLWFSVRAPTELLDASS